MVTTTTITTTTTTNHNNTRPGVCVYIGPGLCHFVTPISIPEIQQLLHPSVLQCPLHKTFSPCTLSCRTSAANVSETAENPKCSERNSKCGSNRDTDQQLVAFGKQTRYMEVLYGVVRVQDSKRCGSQRKSARLKFRTGLQLSRPEGGSGGHQ